MIKLSEEKTAFIEDSISENAEYEYNHWHRRLIRDIEELESFQNLFVLTVQYYPTGHPALNAITKVLESQKPEIIRKFKDQLLNEIYQQTLKNDRNNIKK